MGSSGDIAIGPAAVVSLFLSSVQKRESSKQQRLHCSGWAFFFILSHAAIVGFMGGAAICTTLYTSTKDAPLDPGASATPKIQKLIGPILGQHAFLRRWLWLAFWYEDKEHLDSSPGSRCDRCELPTYPNLPHPKTSGKNDFRNPTLELRTRPRIGDCSWEASSPPTPQVNLNAQDNVG
ncbi:hypothetical protein H6P81_006112 [Aristolochia fimbriata]|uniref:Uncharacterized protein n=1 Tax=Aristolochia fimbriata TaxID=158543 RepID=A0AAV7EWW6_ARIFI|nr:hypothetical protein H6P81_006112 [Aristolochia fimbriata]